MAKIHPFKAWRPHTDNVKDIACPPYDVISTQEARTLAQGKPKSFLHVVRPEIDLPKGTAYNDEAVYQQGADNLRSLMDNGHLQKEPNNCLYIYRLIWNGEPQTGIFGCVSVDDYDNDVILKHELTRPDKEDDRTRHIVEQQAHAEPVMLSCKDKSSITNFMDKYCESNAPLYDFEADDGITHRIWKVRDTDVLVQAFDELDHLYIADGHHRCKSASRAADRERKEQANYTGEEEFNFFPAVIFPMSQMNILPYNRLVFDIPDDFMTQLEEKFEIRPNAEPAPTQKGDICIYIGDSWMKITLPLLDNPTAVQRLDVDRLQEFILEPMLGIDDPRRNENIAFVGGIRGTEELEQRVDNREAQLAVSMYPTAIEELIKVSDEGLLMPPKSTWFEPKLRSGLLIHSF